MLLRRSDLLVRKIVQNTHTVDRNTGFYTVKAATTLLCHDAFKVPNMSVHLSTIFTRVSIKLGFKNQNQNMRSDSNYRLIPFQRMST